MIYLLQREKHDLDVDVLTLKEELKNQKIKHQYVELSLEQLKTFDFKKFFAENIQDIIPVGSLEFVQEYLRINYNITKMNPIEIPNELRLPHLLMRKYQILHKEDVRKITGRNFLKYASKLKEYSYLGDVQRLVQNNDILEGIYVVSEELPLIAEYRIFVFFDEVKGIQFYDGDPLRVLTSENIKKVREMILRYSTNEHRPNAYTLDVGVFKGENKQEVIPIEIHPWCSVGLYGCTGGFLPEAYAEGFKWYVHHNTPLVTDIPRRNPEEELSQTLMSIICR